jgi:mannitol operon transcriptional antiterminator
MLTRRCITLLEFLANSSKPLTLKELSGKFAVSERTIRNDLDKIDVWLSSNKIPRLSRKPKIGIYLDLNLQELRNPLNDLDLYNYIMTSKERCAYILSILFSMKQPISLSIIADRLQVSVSTISNDLKNVQAWLDKTEVFLISKPNYGILIEAEEKTFRKAYVTLLGEILTKKDYKIAYYENKINLLVEHLSNYFFDDFKLLTSNDLGVIIQSIKLIQTQAEIQFTDDAFIMLFLHLIIMVFRIKKGCFINFTIQEMHLLSEQNEFQAAREAGAFLQENLNLEANINEVFYLNLIILSSKILNLTQKKNVNMDALIRQGALNIEALAVSSRIIHEVEKSLNLNNSKSLLMNLALHIKPLLFRLRFKLPLEENPFIDEMKSLYPEVYHVTKKAVETVTGNEGKKSCISEDEIGYIAMHIGAALLKKDKKEECLNILIVCGTGIGTAQILSSKLQIKFSNINIVKIISYHEFMDTINEVKYDLLISTVPLDNFDAKYVLVNPLLNDADIEKLSKFFILKSQNIVLENFIKNACDIIFNYVSISELKKMELQIELLKSLPNKINVIKKNNLPRLKELLWRSSIRLKINVKDWKEAIRYAGNLLVKQGLIDNNYIRAMIRYKEKLGSYIVIDKGVAMPHATFIGVHKPCYSLITLDKSVKFGHADNDPVDVVIVLASVNSWVHIKSLTELMDILNNQMYMEKIRSANQVSEIVEIIMKSS